MKEGLPNNSTKELELVENALHIFAEKICVFFDITPSKFEELLKNTVIDSKLSGHNNDVYTINFYDNQRILIGQICLKRASMKDVKNRLKIESDIMRLLSLGGIKCPKIIDTGVGDDDTPFILMETIDSQSTSSFVLNIALCGQILDTIQAHELILSSNLTQLQSAYNDIDLQKTVDFESKLAGLLKNILPTFDIHDLYDLNKYLNDPEVIKKTIITDRSGDNIFVDGHNEITMIDFSTIRVGTQFDNWIQFIEDPRMQFSCDKEELIQLFFTKNNLSESKINFFYAASIYTNLLQGIFTYKKNTQLAIKYFENANNSFRKLRQSNNLLIDTTQLI